MYGDRLRSYVLLLKYMLLGFVFLNAFQAYGGNVLLLSVFGTGVLLLALNDTVRFRKPDSTAETISLLLSIAGAALMKYYVPGIGTTVYIFVPLFELFYLKRTGFKWLQVAHAAAYFSVLILTVFPLDEQKTAAMGTSTLLYLGVACMSWLLHVNRREREEIAKLNDDLTESNKKLVQYAREVEELTITAERSRMAQELHDSLGHSLMALSMHLDFAEKIIDSKPGQAKMVLGKAKELSRKSAEDLRNAVDALKTDEQSGDLRDSIAELVRSFGNMETEIRFNVDSALSSVSADIKNCIYKTVREAITNGLKHGGATAFDIKVEARSGIVLLHIKDNGAGCAKITESTGLKGMRSRVEALGGRVSFDGSSGFLISANIPLPGEVHND